MRIEEMEVYFKWAREHCNIHVHDGVDTRSSNVNETNSGYGLFYSKVPNIRGNDTETTVELLRINQNDTFDLNSLFRILHNVVNYSNEKNCSATNSIIQDYLKRISSNKTLTPFLSETTLLVFYFTLFNCLKTKYELPQNILYYLNNVLLVTDIKCPITEPKYFQDLYGHYPIIAIHEIILNELKIIFQDELELNDRDMRQIYGSVISRCLEIPEEMSPTSADYTTNTTLVPILDLANHSSNPNAFFDVDRRTNDILLLSDSDVKAQSSSKELFISYTNPEELMDFVVTYGFIPSTVNEFNMSFDRKWLYSNYKSFAKFLKWFDIVPAVRFVKEDSHKWSLCGENISELCIWFMGTIEELGEWSYDSDCYKLIASLLKYTEAHDIIELQKEILQKEDSPNDCMSLPQVAWICKINNGPIIKGINKTEALQLLASLTEEIADLVLDHLLEFIRNYLIWRLRLLELYMSKADSILLQTIKQELDIINNVLQDQPIAIVMNSTGPLPSSLTINHIPTEKFLST